MIVNIRFRFAVAKYSLSLSPLWNRASQSLSCEFSEAKFVYILLLKFLLYLHVLVILPCLLLLNFSLSQGSHTSCDQLIYLSLVCELLHTLFNF